MAVGIAFFRGRQDDDWIRRLIRFATRGPYTHCAVVFGEGTAVEACGRDRRTPMVRFDDTGRSWCEPGWDIIWFQSADDKDVLDRARRMIGRPFNYARVYLGLLHGLLGPLGRYLWRRFERGHDWGEALDCTQLVYEVVGGIGLPVATDPNDLFRRLWANGVTCYAKTGGQE